MTLAKVKEQDGMMLAKVKEQDGMKLAKVKEQDIINSACKSKSPKYHYISGLNRRGGHSLMKQLTVVKGHGKGRGFRICCWS